MLPSNVPRSQKRKKRCSITSESKLTAETGKLACEPLLRGSRHCLFHTEIFNCHPSQVPAEARVFYLDFETTGLDVLTEHIVEVGLLDASGSAVFSTVTRPPVLPGDAQTVHGIAPAELAEGPTFAEAFRLLLRFVENIVEMALAEDSDSSACEASDIPALRVKPPAVVLVAHNGFKFDFPILFVEMLRCGVGLEPVEPWYFVDTLHVLRAADADLTGGCVKLQCLLTRLRASDGGLQAHRALDCGRNLIVICDCAPTVTVRCLSSSGRLFCATWSCPASSGIVRCERSFSAFSVLRFS